MFTGSITNLLCPTLAGSFLLLGYCFTLPVYFFSLPDSFVTFPMPLNLTFSLHTPLTREESHQAGDSYTSLPFTSKWIHIFVPILLSFLSSKRFLDLLSWPSHPSTFSHLPHLPTSDAHLLLIWSLLLWNCYLCALPALILTTIYFYSGKTYITWNLPF